VPQTSLESRAAREKRRVIPAHVSGWQQTILGGLVSLFRPVIYPMQGFPHKGAFTAHRARAKISGVEAVPRAFLRSMFAILKNRALVQIRKLGGMQCKRVPAGMIEQEKARFQFLEMRLVTHQPDGGIFQKIFPV